jgi:hypothetical protein
MIAENRRENWNSQCGSSSSVGGGPLCKVYGTVVEANRATLPGMSHHAPDNRWWAAVAHADSTWFWKVDDLSVVLVPGELGCDECTKSERNSLALDPCLRRK